MGLAIVAAYDTESEIAANAVVVTRVINTTDVFGYSLSVQEGNNLVTNPDPGTYSEVTIAALARRRADVADHHPVREAGRRRSAADLGGASAGRCWRSSTGRRRRARVAAPPGRTTTGRLPFVVVDAEKPTSLDLRAEDPRERQHRVQAGPRVRRPLRRPSRLSTVAPTEPLARRQPKGSRAPSCGVSGDQGGRPAARARCRWRGRGTNDGTAAASGCGHLRR